MTDTTDPMKRFFETNTNVTTMHASKDTPDEEMVFIVIDRACWMPMGELRILIEKYGLTDNWGNPIS